ncbi:hypothetical protein FSP39_011745 [Pinctada imbricata]|uniref:Uncharacterized protein n=1 Tax=Pinctada imbricata TaxID=66713 RepID=A0AA88YE60_PINIB|nr:hypothetical protein FSP39_011745 [Pinctada imbricata]
MMTSLVSRAACRLQQQNKILASCTGLRRFYSQNNEGKKESDLAESEEAEEQSYQGNSYDRSRTNVAFPTTWDKYILVWTKTFPDFASIPECMSAGQLNRAHDIKRIKINLHLFIFGFACLGVGLYEGKKEKASGRKTEQKAQEERMMKWRWEHIKEEEAKAEAKFQMELRKFKEEEAVYYGKKLTT